MAGENLAPDGGGWLVAALWVVREVGGQLIGRRKADGDHALQLISALETRLGRTEERLDKAEAAHRECERLMRQLQSTPVPPYRPDLPRGGAPRDD